MFKGRKQPKSFKSLAAKLNEDKVEEIYIELREGTSLATIGKMFDVSFARSRKYGKEPGERDDFWDTYEPVPELYWPKK